MDPSIFVRESFIVAVTFCRASRSQFVPSFPRRRKLSRSSRVSVVRVGGRRWCRWRWTRHGGGLRLRRQAQGEWSSGRVGCGIWRRFLTKNTIGLFVWGHMGGRETRARWSRTYRGKEPTSYRVQAQQQEVQDSRDIKITKPLCLCKNVKFGPSNAKFAKMHKSMQNCWRAIFEVFGKFQECKVQLHNCWRCSKALCSFQKISRFPITSNLTAHALSIKYR